MPFGNTFGNISGANDWLETGWKRADLARGLSALDRYRMLGLKLAAGDAAGDALRDGRAPHGWIHAGEQVPAALATEPMPRHVRDQRIVELRRAGWPLREIANALGMSESCVSQAITRIANEESPEQRRRRGRDRPSEAW